MGGQLSFDGFEEPPGRPDRPALERPALKKVRVELFFALRPDPETAARVIALTKAVAEKHALPGRLQTQELLHLTLCPLEVAPVDEAIQAAREVAASQQADAFAVSFDELMSFSQGHLVLTGQSGLQSLRAFQQSLRQSLRDAHLPVPSYTPHMTLQYGDRSHTLPRQRLDEPVSWTAQEFLLLRSWIGESRHEVLGRWPLRTSVT